MSAGTAGRLAPLSGVVLVLGLLGALVLYPSDTPDFVDEPANIVAFHEENGTDLFGPNTCYLISGVFVLWFVGTLRARVSHLEVGAGRLAGSRLGWAAWAG